MPDDAERQLDEDLAIGETDNDLAPPAVRGPEALPFEPTATVEPATDAPTRSGSG